MRLMGFAWSGHLRTKCASVLTGLAVLNLGAAIAQGAQHTNSADAQGKSIGTSRAVSPKPQPSYRLPSEHPLRLISIGEHPVYKDLLAMSTNGWLGSDADESIVLSEKTTLWLFGDTFIGKLRNGARVPGAPMVNNTIGLQDRSKAPRDSMTYYWKEANGKPASFFPHQPGTPGEYYWVTKGTMLKDELFLFAWCVSGDAQAVMGFRIDGSALIRVPNPLDPPDKWIQKAHTLKLPKDCTFHAALFVKEPHVYLYGIVEPRQTALARVRIADLLAGKLAEAYEYWVNGENGPEWSSKLSKTIPQFQPVNSECTVHYELAWGLYTCFTYDAFAGPEIYLTTAKEISGPWSKPEPIYSVPEHQTFSFPIISYAVRQHPQLSSRPGEVVLSYVTNVPGSMREHFTEEGKDLYVPRFLRVELEPNKKPKVHL